MTSSRDAVLVSWVSVNHQAKPLLDALSHPKSVLADKIGTLYLCYRDASAADSGAEREKQALHQTVKELRRDLAPVCPTISRRAWKTDASPTDHSAIRPFAEKVLREARAKAPTAPIYIFVSPGTPAMHAVWLVLAATGLIADPVHVIQGVGGRDRPANVAPVAPVVFPLDTWLRRYWKQRPTRASSEDDGHLWDPTSAKSPALKKVMAEIEQYAPLRVPVLLLGERGTGKTTLAGQLRARSPYQGKNSDSWAVVVCGQFRVNPQLARSELFGHKKGAFTGAVQDRAGLIEQADGDTIFFDEIGDIDRDSQRLLMAALEGRGFSRLGDSTLRHSRFRLVCATNRTEEELRGELLDEDFYDRLAMFVVRVPALRECREDLPEFWKSVLLRSQRTAEVEPDGWESLVDHPTVLRTLAQHALPGNLRDLQRLAFHGLAALGSGVSLDDAALFAIDALGGERDRTQGKEIVATRLPLQDGLDAELAKTERAWLQLAFEQAGGNKSGAADMLGLARKTFSDRYKRLVDGD